MIVWPLSFSVDFGGLIALKPWVVFPGLSAPAGVWVEGGCAGVGLGALSLPQLTVVQARHATSVPRHRRVTVVHGPRFIFA